MSNTPSTTFRSELKAKIRHYVEGDYKMTIPLAIPSYKNRKTCILRTPEALPDTDVYVFVYDDDFVNSGYDKLAVPPNVKFVKIYESWRGLAPKRQFIQRYMEKFTDRFFMVDDDMRPTGRITEYDENSTKMARNIPLADVFKVWERYHLENNLQCSTSAESVVAGHVLDTGKLRAENSMSYGSFLVDCKLMRERGVEFNPCIKYTEDSIYSVDCYKAGINITKVMFICIDFNQNINYSIEATIDKWEMKNIETYLACGGLLKFKYSDKRPYRNLATAKCFTGDPLWGYFSKVLPTVEKPYQFVEEYFKKQLEGNPMKASTQEELMFDIDSL
jgi:hypothetical protein